ncbi:hypothetical protein [Gracilibacillus thailandensis]|nr:hypothetical protein [Gracilibacillus thailandensis]
MKKNTISILSVGLALLLVFSPFTSSHVEASDLRKCDMTITSDNTWGKFARPSGDCNEFFKGYYVPEAKQFVVTGSWTGEVTNGQKIRTHLPVGDDYPEYELTVKTVVKQPKPEPEPEEPKPEPKPEPKEPEKEKPKETKPKQPKEDNSKDSSSGDNKSNNDSSSSKKSNNNSSSSNSGSNSSGNKSSNTNNSGSKKSGNSGTSNSGSNSSGTNSTSSNNKGSSSNNSSNNNENVVEGDKELPDAEKEWTIEEMKDKNAKVIDEDGKYFVEIDGVKREITEEQAEELGHEKESDEDDEEKEEDEEKEVEENSEKENEKEAVEEEPSKDQDNDKGNKTKTTVIAVGTTGALAGTIGGIYYFHPSGREAIDKILKKILNLFKFGK